MYVCIHMYVCSDKAREKAAAPGRLQHTESMRVVHKAGKLANYFDGNQVFVFMNIKYICKRVYIQMYVYIYA